MESVAQQDEDIKKIPVEEFIQQIIDDQLSKPEESGFTERLEEFKEHVDDFKYQPMQYIVMCDAYLVFLNLTQEEEEEYLKGGYKVKSKLLNDLDVLNDPQEIVERGLYLCNMLLYTSMTLRDKFYLYVANKLFYILSGEGGFLTDIGMSLYNSPPEPKPQNINVPQTHVPDMYQ